MHASYADFAQFIESGQDLKEHRVTIKLLYEKFLADLSPSDHPFLIAIGGAPGAGKTTFRKQFLQMESAHLHDMDEVIVRLPGYQEDLKTLGAKRAFEKWWPTAQKIAQMLVLYAIESGYSVIYDRTCGTEGSYSDLTRAKERGYHIRLIGLYVNKDVAKERATKREIQEGRAVTNAIIDEYHARFSALWLYYLDLVDEASLYETSSETPRLIFSSNDGIIDEQVYEQFLQDGALFRDYFLRKLAPALNLQG